ncbi:hypothetical protein [Amycolatopsis pittospori]|uniref:hypothetical protein n=1 Tax=Amycolatopsis pittospori TaxID=2749434 RepID=UPI0015F0FE65|nr:hypothetical protein [Amycolatopsis pittospori]
MKIRCVCDGLIVDQTDFQRNKAYLVADQDWFDVLDDEEGQGTDHGLLLESSRTMWQCGECGRLYIDDRSGTLHRFDPAETTVPRDLLASARGARWRGNLRGHWWAGAKSGELWWQCGEDDGGWERFTSGEELERRYLEEFRRLLDLDILRSSFLRLDGEMAHRWPPADGH